MLLWFNGDGLVQRKQAEAQQKIIGSRYLVTNLVAVWNTVYRQQVV